MLRQHFIGDASIRIFYATQFMAAGINPQAAHFLTLPTRIDLFPAALQLRNDAVEIGFQFADFRRRKNASRVILSVLIEKIFDFHCTYTVIVKIRSMNCEYQ